MMGLVFCLTWRKRGLYFDLDHLDDLRLFNLGICNKNNIRIVFAFKFHIYLYCINVARLQVKTRDGNWIDVTPIDGALIVNVAEIWTNGFCHSVVTNCKPTTCDRYLVAAFIDPCLECVIISGDAKGNSNWKG